MMIAQQNNKEHVIKTQEELQDYSKQKTNIVESTVIRPQIQKQQTRTHNP